MAIATKFWNNRSVKLTRNQARQIHTMKPVPQDIKGNTIMRPLRVILLAIFAAGILTGCGPGRGYEVDKKKNEVFWKWWNGSETVSTLVADADAATFELLKLPPKDFARDKN